ENIHPIAVVAAVVEEPHPFQAVSPAVCLHSAGLVPDEVLVGELPVAVGAEALHGDVLAGRSVEGLAVLTGMQSACQRELGRYSPSRWLAVPGRCRGISAKGGVPHG